jgi:hypothetical protein
MNHKSAYNNLRTRLELLERDFNNSHNFLTSFSDRGYAEAMKHVKAIVDDVHNIHEREVEPEMEFNDEELQRDIEEAVERTWEARMRLPRALEDLCMHGDHMELFHEKGKIVIEHNSGCGLNIYFNSPMHYWLPLYDWKIREVASEYKTKIGQEFM